MKFPKVILFTLAIFLGPLFAEDDGCQAGVYNHKGRDENYRLNGCFNINVNPFAVISEATSLGVEFNFPLLLWGYNSNKAFLAGLTTRMVLDSENGGLYVSPTLSLDLSYGVIGVSAGPEFGTYDSTVDYGVSARFWVTYVGVEFARTKKRGGKVGVYLHMPLVIGN